MLNDAANIKLCQMVEYAARQCDTGGLFRAPLYAVSSACDARCGELKRIIGPWVKSPRELLDGAESVISVFLPFSKRVALSPLGCMGCAEEWARAYMQMNAAAAAARADMAEYIRSCGYAVLCPDELDLYDAAEHRCAWPHKSAAVIAGLGAFGLNRSVITPRGSAGRFFSIITAMPLANEMSCGAKELRCPGAKRCGKCIAACPGDALSGSGLDRFACVEKVLLPNAAAAGNEQWGLCGKCIAACPFAYIE